MLTKKNNLFMLIAYYLLYNSKMMFNTIIRHQPCINVDMARGVTHTYYGIDNKYPSTYNPCKLQVSVYTHIITSLNIFNINKVTKRHCLGSCGDRV